MNYGVFAQKCTGIQIADIKIQLSLVRWFRYEDIFSFVVDGSDDSIGLRFSGRRGYRRVGDRGWILDPSEAANG